MTERPVECSKLLSANARIIIHFPLQKDLSLFIWSDVEHIYYCPDVHVSVMLSDRIYVVNEPTLEQNGVNFQEEMEFNEFQGSVRESNLYLNEERCCYTIF